LENSLLHKILSRQSTHSSIPGPSFPLFKRKERKGEIQYEFSGFAGFGHSHAIIDAYIKDI
jgi:hypothetical protein